MVTDRGLERLKGMTRLTILNLSQTPITDAGLEPLNRLTKLESLSLNRTKVSLYTDLHRRQSRRQSVIVGGNYQTAGLFLDVAVCGRITP